MKNQGQNKNRNNTFVSLEFIYGIYGVTRKFQEDKILNSFGKNKVSRSLLSQHQIGVPIVAAVHAMVHGVISLVVSRGKAPKAPTILRYLKPENSQFWIALYLASNPNKQITTSKDMTKDCQSEEKFCYLRNKSTYPNKNSKINFLYFSFLKNEEISFILLQR